MQKQDLEKNYLRLRRDLFDRYYAAMNEKQREAIYQVTGPLLVLAGAGTGKTTVLVNRIAQILRYGRAAESGTIPQDLSPTLLSGMESAKDLSHEELAAVLDEFAEDPCEGYRVLAITFTNKAANEIKERLEALVGERASEVWSGTFHSVCMRILRRYGDRIGYAPGFTIYDTDDQKKVVSESLKQQNIDEKQLPVKTVLNAISRAKDNLLTPDDYESEVGADFRLSQISAVYALYQKKLEDANAVDFDDIIMKTVLLLQKDPEVLAHYQNQFRYVLVDEYQDTNHAQFLLTSLLAGKHKNLMVVGDDDQSIYKFRGATIENILHFDQSFTDAKIIKLEQNYRSTGNILGAANSVIRNNFGRRGKELWCERGDGEKIISCRLDNQISEAAYVVDRIMDLKNREKRKFSDFAVLYRVNAQSLNLEQIFAKSGIPYRLLGGLRFYDRKEVKDILAYLSVINNPSDNLRLRRIINEPKRKIGEATVTALESIAIYESVSMFDAMKNAQNYVAISKSASKLGEFVSLIEELREVAAKEPVSVLIERTLILSGYRDMLIAAGEAEEDRLRNVEELISSAVEYEEAAEEPTLSGFLEEISLVSDIDNYDKDTDAVVLMTIHSAKGLEFPIVFLPGFEEGLFPGMQSALHPEELEEERRLAYVALTRAKDKLYITNVRDRLLYGKTMFNEPSRFFTEIPKEYIETEEIRRRAADRVPAESESFQTKRTRTMSSEFLRDSDLSSNVGKTTGYERFTAGDRVSHLTFGQGTVLSCKEYGADLLYEIAFDDVGTKKLMATYAKLKPVK